MSSCKSHPLAPIALAPIENLAVAARALSTVLCYEELISSEDHCRFGLPLNANASYNLSPSTLTQLGVSSLLGGIVLPESDFPKGKCLPVVTPKRGQGQECIKKETCFGSFVKDWVPNESGLN